jgi:hypothetical protein
MDTTQWIALYGAVTSTIALFMNVALGVLIFRDRYPRIKVLVQLGSTIQVEGGPPTTMLLTDLPGNPPPRDLILSAQNTGQRQVTLGARGYILPTGEHFSPATVVSSVPLPYPLRSGEACHCWSPARDLALGFREHGLSGTIQLIGYYADQLGHVYRAKPFAFDVDAWCAEKASS